jgi:hypothetical protein
MSGGELFQGNGSGGTQKRTKGEFSGYGAPEGEDAEKIVRGIRVRPCHPLAHLTLRLPLHNHKQAESRNVTAIVLS